MRRHYLASTSVRRHVPAGICPPPLGPPNIPNLAPPPKYSKPSYAYEKFKQKVKTGINDSKGLENKIYTMMKGREIFSVTTQFQSPAVVKFNKCSIKGLYFGIKLKTGINDSKGLENKIYTMMKGRETFNGDHTVPITSCSSSPFN